MNSMASRWPLRIRLIPWVFAASFVGLAMLFQSFTSWDHASYRDNYSPPFGTSVPIDQQLYPESFADLYLRRLHAGAGTEPAAATALGDLNWPLGLLGSSNGPR